jgi:hypothetical protein
MYYIYPIREHNIRRFEYSYQIFLQTLIQVPTDLSLHRNQKLQPWLQMYFENHTISILAQLEVIDPYIILYLIQKYHFRYFNCSLQRKCRITLFVYNAGRHLKLVG